MMQRAGEAASARTPLPPAAAIRMAGADHSTGSEMPLSARNLLALVWLVSAVLLCAMNAKLQGWQPADPDDYMRLVQVRDLLEGQAWYDVRQYRIGPPAGADMHWSRLVDLPILAVRLLFGIVLAPAQAETAAMVTVPLLYLLAGQAMLASIVRRLGLPLTAALGAAALVPLFPLLATNFAPFRIDHHTPQLLAALGCASMLLAAPSRKAAVVGGAIAAGWLAISLEGLPLVGVLAALYGVRYLTSGDRSLAPFLAALVAGALVLSLLTRPWSEIAGGACDIVQLGHLAAFGAAAVLAAALPLLPSQRLWQGRLAGLCLLPLICVPILLAALGPCAADPFGGLDPTVRRWWFEFVLEGMPIWRQPISMAAMLVWTPMLVVLGWLEARRTADAGSLQRWTMLALFALAASFYSLFVMRAALAAQIVGLPFAALLIWRYLPRARAIASTAPRLLATVGCLLLATPTGPSALAKPFDRLAAPDPRLVEAGQLADRRKCDYGRLVQIPAALIFAPLDRGPEIIARTHHSVVMAGYHRNAVKMREVIEAFGGDPRAAETRVRASGAAYLLFCGSSIDMAMYRTRRPDNLVNLLAAGRTPAWLEPVKGYENGPLKLYRVRATEPTQP
jgi:hypothetical protein